MSTLQPEAGTPMSSSITSAIDLAFRAHGIESKIVDSCVEVGRSLRIRSQTQVRPQNSDNITVRLDIIIEAAALGQSGPLIDSFAGFGATEAECEKNAFSKFLVGSFHVIAESLTEHRCDSEQVEWESWTTPQRSWKVCSGPLLTQATAECRSGRQYRDVLPKLQDEFARQAGAGSHWVRIFVGFLKGELIAAEALLDGEVWPAGEHLLRQNSWAPSNEYESLRHLLIALPAS
jgi:hypothetical protein